MSWLDRMFGKGGQAPALSAATGDIRHALPLGLRMGSRIRFDRTMYQVAPDAMTAELPDGHQGVECIGHIRLGNGAELHRFYVEDDAYVQVLETGDTVEAMQAFVFHQTVNPPSKAAFQQFVTTHAHLGDYEIEYAGKRWTRVTSAEAGNVHIPPMAFDETLYRGRPPRKDDDLTHYACVYTRHVPELDRDELLLVTGEDYGPAEFAITYAIGLDITEADLDIT